MIRLLSKLNKRIINKIIVMKKILKNEINL